VHPSDRDIDPEAGGDGWSPPQAGDDRGRWVPGTTPAQAGRWVWLPEHGSAPDPGPDEHPTAQLPPPDSGWYETRGAPAAPVPPYGPSAGEPYPDEASTEQYQRPQPPGGGYSPFVGGYPPGEGDAPTEAHPRGASPRPPRAAGFRPAPRGSHLPPYSEPLAGPPPGARPSTAP